MDPVAALLRSIHLLGAIVWFGGALAMNVVVLPVVLDVADASRRDLASRVFFGFERLAIPAALAAAISGLVLGIAYGRITGPAALLTPYGATWLAAVVVTAAVLAVGGRISSPNARRLFTDHDLWRRGSDGGQATGLGSAVDRLRRSLRLELAGLATVFVLMELLATRL
jgi:putative copper export protein